MEKQTRKYIRLANYDYSRNGLYFITICTKNRVPYLSKIVGVGDGVLDVPELKLTEYGKILNDQIIEINSIYKKLKIIKYVIMPDHLHMIIYLFDENSVFGGTSRTPSPTNAVIPSLISTLKRFLNKKLVSIYGSVHFTTTLSAMKRNSLKFVHISTITLQIG
ncbi:transposase [Ruminococcus flavefaciens]|uniref:transposase n=1 Tax=Ruminococcus flavefaciens TaxID=1265 RepID=UPI0026EB5FC7|nr:transposase [Ruminococcus flavefaciens]